MEAEVRCAAEEAEVRCAVEGGGVELAWERWGEICFYCVKMLLQHEKHSRHFRATPLIGNYF